MMKRETIEIYTVTKELLESIKSSMKARGAGPCTYKAIIHKAVNQAADDELKAASKKGKTK